MGDKGQIFQRMQAARQTGRKCLAILIDPDKATAHHLERVVQLGMEAGVDFFLVGGSLVVKDELARCLSFIRQQCTIPTILFPGSPMQIDEQADALLFLSLISGRNAELLIGQQVISAPHLYHSSLEVISVGYMLIDGGVPTTVSYMSNTLPIPADKPDIALATALAGEMLGLKTLYLDAGSGARQPVSEAMISKVRKYTTAPLIVGGGIRKPERAWASASAGADVIVVGNAVEKSAELLTEMAEAVHSSHTGPYNAKES
ncbi:MAG: geranylgeranylglyceryl/heptaprenylglyceryl phosphate synthase [Phaeodactylibacter sp.]|nr:geranylgeranylglyceryl/heptaprenylglyceryl phosphate synthase [Phaeodactylibacter sp.]MCB9051066.1 geranylgeranylglyceryl/heptaprenylglyceryl phosphate synthase [Lewinellaceae bacterium]